MRNRRRAQKLLLAAVKGTFVAAACVLLLWIAKFPHSRRVQANSWNPKTAAAYLDQREGWWASSLGAARDHGTFCVSCHTALPYALSRPLLRKVLSEEQVGVNEENLLRNVKRRVQLWAEIGPYYDQRSGLYKDAESRGTEAILNALILASYDAQDGQIRSDTRAALNNMWPLQEIAGDDKGSWPWLEFGHEEPWEADDSRFYGATLAAMAVGVAPGNYGLTPEIQNNLEWLRAYLNRKQASQSTLNRVALLWASTKLPGLLKPADRNAIIQEVLSKQRGDGGWGLAEVSWVWRGWTMRSIGRLWFRSDGSSVERGSDGYATGLIALTLEQAGISPENPQLLRALFWLARHQEKQGYWRSSSLNKKRSLSSNAGLFMSDAATAYAVLALTNSKGQGKATANTLKASFALNQ